VTGVGLLDGVHGQRTDGVGHGSDVLGGVGHGGRAQRRKTDILARTAMAQKHCDGRHGYNVAHQH